MARGTILGAEGAAQMAGELDKLVIPLKKQETLLRMLQQMLVNLG